MCNRKLNKLLLLLLLGMGSSLSAQIPYFANSPVKGKVTGYSSLSVATSEDHTLATYSFAEYGIINNLSCGLHFVTDSYYKSAYWGPELRGGYSVNKYFSFSLHAVPSFNLNDKCRFTDMTMGLYMSGAILPNHELFWLTNTYGIVYPDASTSWAQYWYLGSYLPVAENHALMPMVGCTHSWRFEANPDISVGLMYTYKEWTFIAWCSQIISWGWSDSGKQVATGKPLVSMCVEFDIPTSRTNN